MNDAGPRGGGQLLSTLAALGLGSLLGLASAWLAIARGPHARELREGPWVSSAQAGSVDAGLHARAGFAVTALFALDPSEAVYHRAAVDDDGLALRSECSYLVTGRPPAARWWSLTLYGEDKFLVPEAEGRHSITASSTALDERGRFVVRAGAGDADLPAGPSGGFDLLLRLYQPAAGTAELPSIVKESCP